MKAMLVISAALVVYAFLPGVRAQSSRPQLGYFTFLRYKPGLIYVFYMFRNYCVLLIRRIRCCVFIKHILK